MILGIDRRILVKVLCNYSPIMISSHHTPCNSRQYYKEDFFNEYYSFHFSKTKKRDQHYYPTDLLDETLITGL